MEFRKAIKEDLPKLESLLKGVIKNMHDQGIKIWNEYYPYEEYINDIENNQLFVLDDNGKIACAFSLLENNPAESFFNWEDVDAKVLYGNRLAVSLDYSKQGIGKKVMEFNKEYSHKNNYAYFRLLVGENNYPAIRLYEKSGYKQVEGKFVEYSPASNCDIIELGYELKIK